MKKDLFIRYLIIFLVLNFLGLALGGLSTNSGVNSEWYNSLNKAPWTPPGWVFGAAWTFIMICFSVYLATWFVKTVNRVKTWLWFAILWLLNVVWNPIFFTWQLTELGLLVISLLCILLIAFFLKTYKSLTWKIVFLIPYLVWMSIAVSLNAYVVFFN